MCVLLCPTNDLVSIYGDILRLAKEVACKVLNPRGGSAHDREGAAHDAAADLYLIGVPGLPWREEVERELRVSIQGFRRCEGKTRKFNYHYKDIGGLDRAIANQSVYRITTSEVVEGGLQRENEISLCRALLEDPRTSAAVKPVCLLATVTQVEPKLVTEAMIDDALDASRPSRNEGILRSRASFLELFAPALNDLALAMELNPSCKQWPSR